MGGWTSVAIAASRGYNSIVDLLLQHGADVEIRSEAGYHTLHAAASSGEPAVVESLLKYNVEIDVKTTDGSTPLHVAAEKGHVRMIELLVSRGADIDLGDKSGLRALHKAVLKNGLEAVQCLLELGAGSDLQDNEGNTAMHLAASNGYVAVIQALLNGGASDDLRDKERLVPLQLALKLGRGDVVEILKGYHYLTRQTRDILSKPDREHLEAMRPSASTAVARASQLGLHTILRQLLEKGCDPSAVDMSTCFFNQSALTCALTNNSLSTVRLLVQFGAKWTDQDRIQCLTSPKIRQCQDVVAAIWNEFNPFVTAPDDPSSCTSEMTEEGAYIWTHFMSSKDLEAVYEPQVSAFLDRYIGSIDSLVRAEDSQGRKAFDIATAVYRKCIKDRYFFMRRFKFREGPPEHTSATCIVRMAWDMDEDGKGVAVKFMQNRDQYLRELRCRQLSAFSPLHVISLLTSFDSDVDVGYREEALKKGFYPYCVVMPAGERNLGAVLAHEHIAARDWPQLRTIALQVTEAVAHVHSKGLIHGDIKPLNIIRSGGRFCLIDLDATVSYVAGQKVGAKCSSGYLPPEMVAVLEHGRAYPRSYPSDPEGNPVTDGLPYALVDAAPSHDMWALGVTLFQLFAGEPLFLMNHEGNIDETQLITLSHWKDDFKRQKLQK
eukprot:gene896-1001_t